jgi:hypothetical protein
MQEEQKTHTYENYENGENTCPICLDILVLNANDNTTNFFILECHHAFHATCLVPLFRLGQINCPLCRHNPHEQGQGQEQMPPSGFTEQTRAERRAAFLAQQREQERHRCQLCRTDVVAQTLHQQCMHSREEMRKRTRDIRALESRIIRTLPEITKTLRIKRRQLTYHRRTYFRRRERFITHTNLAWMV